LFIFPFITFPLDGNWNPFNHHVVWSHHKKLGYWWEPIGNLKGTCWEQTENNPSLLGAKFDTIL
jgi:hypothetical protein